MILPITGLTGELLLSDFLNLALTDTVLEIGVKDVEGSVFCALGDVR